MAATMSRDGNCGLHEDLGLRQIAATHARRALLELVANEQENKKTGNGTAHETSSKTSDGVDPHCMQCGLSIPPTLKLPVCDPYDPYVPSGPGLEGRPEFGEPQRLFSQTVTHKGDSTGESKTQEALGQTQTPAVGTSQALVSDYVRMFFDFDESKFPRTQLSPFVFCTTSCALRYMLDYHSVTSRAQLTDMFYRGIRFRHGMTEPPLPAPPVEALASMWEWSYPSSDSTNSITGQTSRNETVGLGKIEFLRLLAQTQIVVYIAGRMQFVAPENEEHDALNDGTGRYASTMFTDGLDVCILADLQQNISADRAPLANTDAYPDSDGESDYSTLRAHSAQKHVPSNAKKYL